MLSAAAVLAWAEHYYWPFLRLSALFLAAPVFGAASFPVRARVILALAITVLVAPVLPQPPAIDVLGAEGMLVAGEQILVGLAMGFVLQMALSAAVMAGQTISMTIGLGFALSVDPQNGVQVPVVSQFYVILATLLFLAIDGHLVLIETLVDSFHVLPVGAGQFSDNNFGLDIAILASRMFMNGLLLVLPALTAVLLINLAFGVITRAAPQLNIFAVGFPVTILAGFVFIFLSLPAVIPLLERMFDSSLAAAFDVIR
ncbi:MAG: flagellar biosynthetic protein FliR [Halioglobus sp.]|nr:flagellar biosynthetic protein FliR [Halioglobus sp.]